MGKGICADCYVGDRVAQELFRREMGGSGEYPYQIRERLDRSSRRRVVKKAVPAINAGKKNKIMNKFNRNSTTINNLMQNLFDMPPAQVMKE